MRSKSGQNDRPGRSQQLSGQKSAKGQVRQRQREGRERTKLDSAVVAENVRSRWVSGNLSTQVSGSVLIKSGTSFTNESGPSLTNKSGTSLTNQAGTSMSNQAHMSIESKANASHTVESSGIMAVKGSLVKIN